MEPLEGRIVGPYKIERLLGRGGMGSVYLAVREDTGEEVAIKVLSEALSANEKTVERFRREALAGALLDHPNVVRLMDAGIVDGRPYFAMEYVRGKTLDLYLEERRRLEPAEVVRLARQLGSALRYLHKKGLLHRDLKPSNVIMDQSAGWRARLMDFGVVKIEDLVDMTQEGAIVGTLRFTPPEVVEGAPHTAAGDIYQMGLILYEAASGEIPFGTSSAEASIERRKAGVPKPVHKLCRGVGKPLSNLISNCLVPDPARRYASATAFLKDVERARRNRPVVRRYPVVRGSRKSQSAVMVRRPAAASVAPPEASPPRSLRLDPLWAAILSAVFLALALRPWQFLGTGEGTGAQELAVKAGARRAVVTWVTGVPCPSALRLYSSEYGLEKTRDVGDPAGRQVTTRHRLVVDQLAPKSSYRVRVLSAAGDLSAPARFRTQGELAYGEVAESFSAREGYVFEVKTSVPAVVGAHVFQRGREVFDRRSAGPATSHRFVFPDLPHATLPTTVVLRGRNELEEDFPARSIKVATLPTIIARDASQVDLAEVLRALRANAMDGEGAAEGRGILAAARNSLLAQYCRRFLRDAPHYYASMGVGLDQKVAFSNAIVPLLLADVASACFAADPIYGAQGALAPFLRSDTWDLPQGQAPDEKALGKLPWLAHPATFFPANAPEALAREFVALVSPAGVHIDQKKSHARVTFEIPDGYLKSTDNWIEIGLLVSADSYPSYYLMLLNGLVTIPLVNPARGAQAYTDVITESIKKLVDTGTEGRRRILVCRIPRLFVRVGKNEVDLTFWAFLPGTCHPGHVHALRIVPMKGSPLVSGR